MNPTRRNYLFLIAAVVILAGTTVFVAVKTGAGFGVASAPQASKPPRQRSGGLPLPRPGPAGSLDCMPVAKRPPETAAEYEKEYGDKPGGRMAYVPDEGRYYRYHGGLRAFWDEESKLWYWGEPDTTPSRP